RPRRALRTMSALPECRSLREFDAREPAPQPLRVRDDALWVSRGHPQVPLQYRGAGHAGSPVPRLQSRPRLDQRVRPELPESILMRADTLSKAQKTAPHPTWNV